MARLELEAMSLDELWELHERVIEILSDRIMSEKQELEQRLEQLRGAQRKTGVVVELDRKSPARAVPRRHYPQVLPKYQNPSDPSETWSGRGKAPRWLVSALQAGGKIEDFRIPETDSRLRAGQ
jgi:DNA-binding protein H-NS